MIPRNSDPTRSYFSRAGKASLSKYKILGDRDKILRGEKISPNLPKVQSQPLLSEHQLNHIVSQELESLKSVKSIQRKPESKAPHLSAAFMSPGRKDPSPTTEVPDFGRYDINYSLVDKTPIIYSIPKHKKNSLAPINPDSFLSSNLHQFPESKARGILFQQQTSRKDITNGYPSPHDERFVSHNLIPTSCSKYSSVSGPDLAKYAERKEIYRKKEYSPDYLPNKEFVLRKLAVDIKFENMTERKSVCDDRNNEWEKRFENSVKSHGRESFIKDLARKQGFKDKVKAKGRVFSPSKFLSIEGEQ